MRRHIAAGLLALVIAFGFVGSAGARNTSDVHCWKYQGQKVCIHIPPTPN